jgi:response regulator NasT
MKSVLLAFQNDQASAVIKNVLVQGGYKIYADCRSGAEVIRTAERCCDAIPTVVCGFRLTDMTARDLYDMLPKDTNIVVLLSPQQSSLRFDFPPEMLALNLPVARRELMDTLENIEAMAYERNLHRERVQRSVDDKKIIDEAKAILMTRHMMTEVQAHRYLQRQSMNNGRKMVDTAALIISRGS